MGTGTFVRERPYTSNNSTGVFRGFDMPLLVVVVALTVFGLAMLYSSSWDFSLGAYGDAMYMFNRQLTWLGLGFVTAIVLAFFDYHYWRKLVVPAMAVTIILLITVLFMNGVLFGAKRSILGGSVQPSELAKLVSIMYLSVWLYAKRESLHDVSLGLIPLGVILGVVGGLIYQQPGLGCALPIARWINTHLGLLQPGPLMVPGIGFPIQMPLAFLMETNGKSAPIFKSTSVNKLYS